MSGEDSVRLLVTGGAGFIGSNFIRYVLRAYPSYEVINLDALTYAGNPQNLADIESTERYFFMHGRIEDTKVVVEAMEGVDAVVHLAAESHVDRSIEDAAPFLATNVLGTQVVLDAARKTRVRRFLHVSTDEVYGTIGSKGPFTEKDPLWPRSPYAASKAAADHLVQAYTITYQLPIIIVRPSNVFGPYQYPEKFIPLLVTNAFEDRSLPIYGDGKNIREWIYVGDVCFALDLLLHKGRPGETYNIGGSAGWSNLEVAKLILALLKKPESLITFVPDRPGHDLWYALDNSKVKREIGWEATVSLEQGLKQVIVWYQEHRGWWEGVKDRLHRESRGYWS